MIEECPFLREGKCLVASKVLLDITGRDVAASASEQACSTCLKSDSPMQINQVTVSLALSAHSQEVNDKEEWKRMLIMLKEHLKRHYPAKDLAKRYAISTSKWAKAGFPERSDEETRGILSICKSNECGKYRQVNDRGGWCASCGCNLTEGSAVLNKIRRSTESCPEGLW